MKKLILLIVLTAAPLLMTFPSTATGQVASGGSMTANSLRGNPVWSLGSGSGLWQPWSSIHIPAKLPTPGNAEWVKRLKAAWTSEIKALAQFEADQQKFNAFMPYMIVIPETDQHIRWIEGLFKAYGLAVDEELYLVGPAKSLKDAYEKSEARENELIPQFEWLVKNAEDRDSARVLDTMLLRCRFHYVMFEHVLRMGHGYALTMRGIMGLDYGYSFGGGLDVMVFGGRRFPAEGKLTTAGAAESLVKKYLQSSRNPNLRIGRVRDAGESFEVEIVTLKDSLVDKILVEKSTGWMRSAY
ncbi:MAG: hypothetical protein PHN75_07900 [Syntrophales bacterium]|nr:hypothetical protein [Syntrophales bacterium]